MKKEEIFEYVKKQYGTVPEYLWAQSPDNAVLRHKNGKWYAVVMSVEKCKLGLSDMIYRGMTLVKFYAPNGVMLSEILHSCFCSHYNKTDVEVQQELGVGRTSFYKMKKQALGYLGFYFYEIVVPQAKDKRFKPSLGVEEE